MADKFFSGLNGTIDKALSVGGQGWENFSGSKKITPEAIGDVAKRTLGAGVGFLGSGLGQAASLPLSFLDGLSGGYGQILLIGGGVLLVVYVLK